MLHFSEFSTVAANCNTETQIEMRDGTVEHFPVCDEAPVLHGAALEVGDGDALVLWY